ncbi:nucleolar MIF4G domain-containing protein 1 isoform X1 [Patella vulgata]|uniref:nucleolar MIF4G domain-containing protein 1 isoform X1 n=1 Tax=Patella vulgata TaxID=6465 RepID=UPI0024A7DBD8|nr:nucleolar MIF4G domain-containing protein 1 isoform X1 [Patella vulgata]
MKEKKNFTKVTKKKGKQNQNGQKSNDNTRKQKLFKINLVNDKLTRKQKRKEFRKLKKLKKNAFHRKEEMPSLDVYLEQKKIKFQTEIEQKKKKKETIQNKIAKLKEKKIKKKVKREAERERLNAEREEEQEMKKIQKVEEQSLKELEKKLNLNKRRKTLPQGFINDGLDYLLEVVDGKTDIDYEKEKPDWLTESDEEEILPDMEMEDDDKDEDDLMEEPSDDSDEDAESDDQNIIRRLPIMDESGSDMDDSDNESDEDTKTKPKSILKTKKLSKNESSDQKSISWREEIEEPLVKKKKTKVKGKDDAETSDTKLKVEDDGSDGEFEEDIYGRLKKKKKLNQESESEEELQEDIYGRVKNSKGDVLSSKSERKGGGGAYIPPARRAMMMGESESRKQVLEKLKKQLKGLINRASEANIQSISNQIEELHITYSRADISQTLNQLIMAACISPTLTPERLCQELVLLVAVLHNNVGMEVGAQFLQTLVTELDELFNKSNYGVGKTMENILMLITTLYNYQVVHCNLVFDIIKRCLLSFNERDIELLLFILKNVGFTLRKDDPVKLKEIIQLMQSKATDVDKTTIVEKSRVQFMLEIILAIKNNNMRKIPNYDPTRVEHLKKLLRNFTRGGNLSSNQLCISLEDLLQADKQGKWWLVGSAWSGRDTTQDVTAATESVSKTLSEANSALLELAQKQRMNTDTRKSIFLILMTSEDFVDAFEKLLGLGLKHQQEREIIHVIMSCCLQEKEYNPYYAYLIMKFCQFDRRFQMTLQFYLWDKFKEMSNLSIKNVHNLASVVNHQLVQQAVNLSILKVIEFGTLDKAMVNFLRIMLEQLLLDNSSEVIESIFLKVSVNDKLRHLQEGLKLFLVHFLIRKKGKDKTGPALAEKVAIAEKALNEGQRKMLL